ncbi:MAG TPA: sugar phosphate isomerase/epimerase family protein [Acidimicrobiales bacterium]
MPVHPRVSVNPMATVSLPLADAVDIWRALDVSLVGLNVMQLETCGWERAVEIVRGAGLRVAYLNHGIPCAVTDDTGWAAAERVLCRAVETAAAVGAPTFYFCTGSPGHLRWEEAVELLGRRLAPVQSLAEQLGVSLALENGVSSRPELGFLHSVRDTAVAARQIGTGICVDLYGCWVEPQLVETLRANLDLIRLVQFSDFVIGTLVQPNRWVPGDGDLPLERLLDDVLASGYRGVFDLELLGPAINEEGAEPALRRGLDWLTRMLDARGV